jgi:hypothetical protein
VLRHEHRAGEKMFVDHAGQTVPVTDPKTGEVRPAVVFVAVLGTLCSNTSHRWCNFRVADKPKSNDEIGVSMVILVQPFSPIQSELFLFSGATEAKAGMRRKPCCRSWYQCSHS